jgi:hypothetical protein
VLAVVVATAGCGNAARTSATCSLRIYFRPATSPFAVGNLMARLRHRTDVDSVLYRPKTHSLLVLPKRGTLPGHIASQTPRNPNGISHIDYDYLPECAD